jgi:NitT/TauT family transport system ATP-binding protein
MAVGRATSTDTGGLGAGGQGFGASLRGVSKRFRAGKKVVGAVEDVSLEIGAGEFVALLGPSGCGKSTLLRMIAGLEALSAGELRVDRRGREAQTGDTAFVFQDAHLLPWRSVLDNAALPLELMGAKRADRHEQASAVLKQVGLGDAMSRYPAQLSGGMRMRVSLARALVTNPQLLLLDEPFAALDELTRQQLDEQLRELWLRRKMTVLFVTHSISEAVYLAGRAVVFSRRPARVVLDEQITLPEERAGYLRMMPAFAEIGRRLFGALHAQEEQV